MRSDRRRNMKQNGVSVTVKTRINFTCDSRKKESQGKISVTLNQWGGEAMYISLLPIRVLIYISTCQ
jgi:hypothetical protein